MYRLPAGFAVECIRALTSGGHSTCHTSARRFAVPDVHTQTCSQEACICWLSAPPICPHKQY
eukprot:8894667-Ditylum_brightwellii.AAC.1